MLPYPASTYLTGRTIFGHRKFPLDALAGKIALRGPEVVNFY